MLIFYTNPMSRGRIARWMLEETGVSYETRVLDYGTTMKDSAYLEINPMGKVPAIVHDGNVVTETAAIIAYLADAFPEAGLAPNAGERADYYRWMFYLAGPAEAAITNKAAGLEIASDKQAMAGYGNYDLMVEGLKLALRDKAFVCGERFTAADVYVGAQIGWGLQFGTLPGDPIFEAYRDRVMSRPAYVRATSIDDALLS